MLSMFIRFYSKNISATPQELKRKQNPNTTGQTGRRKIALIRALIMCYTTAILGTLLYTSGHTEYQAIQHLLI